MASMYDRLGGIVRWHNAHRTPKEQFWRGRSALENKVATEAALFFMVPAAGCEALYHGITIPVKGVEAGEKMAESISVACTAIFLMGKNVLTSHLEV